MSITRQRDQWPHRTASLHLAEDRPDLSDYEFYSVPVGHRTPRWNITDRPELPDGSRYFSPTEVNPYPDNWSRPDLGPRQYDISPHPALPLKTPGVKQHNSDFDNFQAVDRRPNSLYRGIAIDFGDRYNRSAPMDRIRRLLHGSEYEDDAKAGPINAWGRNADEQYLRPAIPYPSGKDYRPGERVMPSDYEAAAEPHPLGYDHPELPHLLMEHLLDTDWPEWDIHPDSLGTHWTTDLGTAAQFAGVLSANMRGNPRRLSAILEGHWRGLGEDPYRRNTGGDFDNEQEITLLRGAPLGIHQVHLFNPHTREWHTHNMGGMERHAHRLALTLEEDSSIGDYAPRPMPVPETKSLPQWYDPEQGEHVPYFRPDTINPRPDTSARPEVRWTEITPPQDTLPLGVDAYRHIGGGEGVPVDRAPVTLYRAVNLDSRHPDIAPLHRALLGTDPDNEPEPGHGLAITPWLTQRGAEYHPGGPPLAHAILDHLQRHYDKRHGLGRHWSLDPGQAMALGNEARYHYHIPVLLSAHWMGQGEDPYRRGTAGHWHDEQEITLMPGAPVRIHRLEVQHPGTDDWYPIPLDTPSPRTATRKQ